MPFDQDAGLGHAWSDVDELRAISLAALLAWHGFDPKPEGRSVRAKTDRYNIVVTGSRWFDNKAGTGGAGAIYLQMHLTGDGFPAACHTLANQFRPLAASHSGIAFHAGKPAVSNRLPFAQLMAKYAKRNDDNWPLARAYLVDIRGIAATVVDELHNSGAIYANDHRPNPSLVFLHRTSGSELAGASLRDTREGSSFRPTLGNKTSAWFVVGDIAAADSIVAVESPIDALSYHTLFGGRGLAIASCSGSAVPDALLSQAYDRRQRFVVALDNDSAGERGWQRAWDHTADWTGFKISSECPRLKDWNAELMASVQSVRAAADGKRVVSRGHEIGHD